ncbi:hypothetical protein [Luteibacter yeojuensis]|uniref:Uncharacterized protein n=1 Tax=Luteibacter yeojuensis TaxID=345309 RepID=A0A7X5QS95_9GAMM|nr:hypothetical protein [Luteibacter yeojuensis]NID14497.1 hypothetical protein [Luteibacter yeojuensis]
MPSPSESSRVGVSIVSRGCASELYVVNRAYALVAQGVGALRLQLEPGRYKVRQRIGYCEQVHELEVVEASRDVLMVLPDLDFPSPIPLAGTSFVSPGMARRPFSLGTGNFRFVLWVPVDEGMTPAARTARLRSDTERLRLERFDGEFSMRFDDAILVEERQGMRVFGADVEPGHYLVVQDHPEQRQVCLPILILQDRTTMVFSLALEAEGLPVPVRLEHAAVAMLRNDELDHPYESSLLRLEAARKASGAGRHVYGWSQVSDHPASDERPSENILLDLLDAQLGLRRTLSRASQDDAAAERTFVEDLVHPLEQLASKIGDANADVAALRSFLGVMPAGTIEALAGPPLLRRNWDHLLSAPEGNVLAADLMAFSFQVEPSPAWFLWSEAPGARAASFAARHAGAIAEYSDYLLLPTPSLGSRVASEAEGEADTGLKVFWPLPVRHDTLEWASRHFSIFEKALSPAPAVALTVGDVETMLAALIQNESFADWLDRAQSDFNEKGPSLVDASLQRLVTGLRVLSDPTLINLLGADAVIKQALAALRLPQSRVVQLAKDLLKEMAAVLPESEQAAVRQVLHGFDAAAENWLEAGR